MKKMKKWSSQIFPFFYNAAEGVAVIIVIWLQMYAANVFQYHRSAMNYVVDCALRDNKIRLSITIGR